jgi:NADH-quinone oxidoreductase subunit L
LQGVIYCGAGQYALFAVGALTAGMTAFYSFRMLGMVFFGKQSQRLEQVEAAGHHVHEPSPIMWVPYALLAAASVVIGLAALAGQFVPSLNVEATLEAAANTYVQTLYPTQNLAAAAPSLNVPASGLTGLFVAIGLLAAVFLYVARRVDPHRIVGETGFMRGLYTFLEKRWYINAAYYKVFVDAPVAASRWLSETFDLHGLFRVNEAGSVLGVSLSSAGNWIDTRVVDGAVNGISSLGQAVSRAIRRMQTGIVEQYAQVFAIGVILMLALLLLAVGVKLP